MKRTLGLQMAGATVGALLISATYISIRNRRRDQMATQLLGILGKKLNVQKGLDMEEAFDIHYKDKVLQQVSGSVPVLKKTTANRYSTQIHNAFRPWYRGGDLEEVIYGVLGNLKDKVQASQVAHAYQQTYGIALKDQLEDRFDQSELKKVLAMVSRLPAYRKI